jgi:hypothetical protein
MHRSPDCSSRKRKKTETEKDCKKLLEIFTRYDEQKKEKPEEQKKRRSMVSSCNIFSDKRLGESFPGSILFVKLALQLPFYLLTLYPVQKQ